MEEYRKNYGRINFCKYSCKMELKLLLLRDIYLKRKAKGCIDFYRMSMLKVTFNLDALL